MIDLHTHSNFSDGTLPPEKLVEEAYNKRLTLLALTDHDTVGGVPRARNAARALGVPFINGVELEAEYDDQLHILGLGVDPEAEKLSNIIAVQDIRRNERNERVLEALSNAGMNVRAYLHPSEGTVTRANIARAMLDAGYVSSISEAFKRFLGRGQSFFVPQAHPSIPEVLDAITEAGGVSVLAHPMNMRVDPVALMDELNENGLWGVEAYYGGCDKATVDYYASIAHNFRLSITCGSDFHGANRPGIELGCSWRPTRELERSEDYLRERFVVPRRRARGISPNDFQLMAERILEELPGEFFNGLTGGVVISDHEKQHRLSLPQRPLYVLGEYHYGRDEGRYITLYYGSFIRARGSLSRGEAYEELRKVILHEFRHHLEIRAGQHDLEYKDDEEISEYLRENSAPPKRPDVAFAEKEDDPRIGEIDEASSLYR